MMEDNETQPTSSWMNDKYPREWVRLTYAVLLQNSDPEAFKKDHRMQRSTFDDLLEDIKPFWTKFPHIRHRCSISVEEVLLFTLRVLANGSCLKDMGMGEFR